MLVYYRNLLFSLLYSYAKLVQRFLTQNFYTRSNYSNRAVIYVNHIKILLHENFVHENKNYAVIDCII